MTRRAGLRRFARGWAGRLALAAAAAAWGFAALAQGAPPKPFGFSVTLVETKGTLEAYVPSSTTVTSWDYRQRTGSNGNSGDWQKIVSSSWQLIASTGNLDRGKTYGFQVRAVNNAGEGPESDSKEVSVPAVAPPTPSSFTATAGDRQVTLSASIDTDGGSDITRWQYQQKTGSDGSYGKWKDIDSSKAKTSISTVIAGLTNGTAYGFKIRAENGAGRGGESESGMVTPSTTPAAPTGLTATAGNGEAALSWTAGSNGGSAITGWKYLKHSSNNWDNDWTEVPNSGASTTSYTVPDLTNGTAYKFKVRAVNANGDGAESAESASAMPSAPATASPGKPSVTAVIPIGGCILVRWQPPADDGGSAITGYEIGDPGSGISHNEASANSREAKWPPAGNNRCSLVDRLTYGMQVRAKNANGNGDWSDEIGVQPTKTGVNVSGITWEAATLSVDNLSKAPWWYKGEQAGAQCTAVAKGTTTANLAGLDANTDHTYAVYYDSNCPSGSKLNSKSFKTLQAPTLAASAVTHNTATLTVGRYSGDWHYKANAAPHASCSSSAVSGTTKDLTDLSGNTSYTYKAYSDSSCTMELATAGAFLTEPAKPAKPTAAAGAGSGKLTLSSSVTGGGALTKWRYRQKSADDTDFGSWQDIESTSNTLSHTVSGLTDGTAYKFEVRAVNATGDGAISDESDEATPLASAPVLTPPPSVTLTASDVTATKAKLAIANWSGAWSYQDGQKGHYISCTNVAAGTAEASLSGLTPGRDYLVYAYGKHNCPVNDNTLPRTLSVIFTTLLSKVEGVSVSAGGGSLSVGWTAQSGVTGYHVQWKSGSEDWSSDRQQDATANSAAISNLTAGAAYTVRVRSYHRGYKNRVKYGEWSDPATATTQAVTLTASGVTHDSAVLTIANHTGNWRYKATVAPHASCSSNEVTGTTKGLTGLSGNTSYTYTAYSDSGCSSELATADAFLTKPAKPAKPTAAAGAGSGKLTLSSSVTGGSGALTRWEYKWSEVGGSSESNWEVVSSSTSTTLNHTVSGLDDNKSYTFKVRAVNATGTGAESAESDEATPKRRTGGGNPLPPDSEPGFAAGADIPDREYTRNAVIEPFVLPAATGGDGALSYSLSPTLPAGLSFDSAARTLSGMPTAVSEATVYSYTATDSDANDPDSATLTFTIEVIEPAALTASAVTETAATLTITGHSGDWWYRYIVPSGGSCSSNAVSGASVDLRELLPNTGYTFKAYGDSACTTELAAETLLTRPAKPSGVKAEAGAGSAKLTLWASVTGNGTLTKWQYRQKAGAGAFGSWIDISSTSTTLSHTLSGLTDGASYRFRVRAVNATGEGAGSEASDPAMPAEAALAASSVTHNSATLTIANHSGDWWLKRTTPAGTACKSKGTAMTEDLSGLTPNTDYAFKAYGDSACTDELASETLLTGPGKPTAPTAATGAGSGKFTLSASVTGSGTLTKWQYRQKAATDTDYGAWTDIASTSTTLSHTLTGLTDGTSYRFRVRAVNATGEGPASNASGAAMSAAPTLTASAVKETTATLRIGSYSGNWWYKGNRSGERCTAADAGTVTASLSGLTGGASYIYKAYGDSGCTAELTADATDAEFSTVGLTAGSIVQTGAALTIANWTAAWWYEGNRQGAQCTFVKAKAATASLSGLTAGTSYTYTAYGATGCGSADKIADVDFETSAATAPGAPSQPDATAGLGSVGLRWTSGGDGGSPIAKWQYAYRTTGGYGDWTDICVTSDDRSCPDRTSHTVANLTDATDHRFKVRAVNGVGSAESPESAAVRPVTVLDGARDTVRKVLNRTLAAVGTRTLTSALGNIGTRLTDGAPGASLTLAGQAVPLEAGAAPAGIAGGHCTTGIRDCGAAKSRAVGLDELFRASAFSILLGTEPGEAGAAAGPLWSLWGRGDFGSFEGRPEPGSSYSGEMRTGWLGFDGRAGSWVAGLAVSHGESETDYVFDSGGGIDGRGRLETELTAVYPYGRWTLPDGLELRGAVGVGSGEAHHRPEGGARETSALSMRMASTGLRRALPMPSGLDLALRVDASVVRMEIGDGPELVSGVSADSWRLRAGLEASRRFELDDGAALEPFAEAAGRRDGGDGVTGTGLEVAGGLRYTAPRLQVEARGRWLAAHSEEGARERGVSVTARVGPGAQGRGLSLSLSPRWGADAGTAEALWKDGMPGRAGDEAGVVDAGALDARLGYGFASGPGGLLTPFAEMGLSEGDSQRIRLGTRFEAERAALALELSGERRESDGAPPDRGVRLDVRLRF